MFAIDTNILIRIIVDDKNQFAQCEQARQFAKKHKTLFVPQTVQIELIWVLDFSYKLTNDQILAVLKHLFDNVAFVLQDEELFIEAISLFENTQASFADCIIYLQSKKEDHEVVTFDKKFSKLEGVKLLS